MKHSNNNKKYFFEIKKNQFKNLFYFNLKDEEGYCLLSDYYTNKTDSQNWINSVIINSKNEERFIIKQTYEEKWIFYLRDENGKIIAVSPYFFDTIVEAKNFTEDLKSLSPETPVIDKTE